MNKGILIGGLVIVVLLGLTGFFWYKVLRAPAAPAATKAAVVKHKITDPVNTISVNDGPYLNIIPQEGHNIAIEVNALKKPATTSDFEIENQKGTQLGGAQGSIPLDKLPTTKQILLGTCSTGGACTYDTDVQGGTLLMKFSGGPDSYTLKQDWRYIENTTRGTSFGSRDAAFQIDSKDLATQKLMTIYNTPGYPGTVSGTVISSAYTLNGLTPPSGKGTVTFQLKDAVTAASVMGYDGTTWKEYPATVSSANGGTAVKADVDLLQVYLVVKK